MPGYTHLKRAEPVTFGHWCLAYVEMLLPRRRPLRRRARARATSARSASGALSGTPAADRPRARSRASLGFAAADGELARRRLRPRRGGRLPLRRDAPPRRTSRGSAEDLIFFTSDEAGFVELPDALATGSSRMPQKKNPDVLELVARARRARDRRADRVPRAAQGAAARVRQGPAARQGAALPDARRPRRGAARARRRSSRGSRSNRERMRAAASDDRLLATELADALATRGMPFREAHEIVGRTDRGGRGARQKTLAALGPSKEITAAAISQALDRRGARSRSAADGRHPPTRVRGARSREGRRAGEAGREGGAAMKLPKGFLGLGRPGGHPEEAAPTSRSSSPRRARTPRRSSRRTAFRRRRYALDARAQASGGRVRAVVVNAGCANAVTGKPRAATPRGGSRRRRRRAPRLSRRRRSSSPRRASSASSSPTRRSGPLLPDAMARLSASAASTPRRARSSRRTSGPKVAQASFASGGRRGPGRRLRQGRRHDPPEHGDDARVRHDRRAGDARRSSRRRSGRRVDESFNAISVDGDTSTNDTVLVLASGDAGGPSAEARRGGAGVPRGAREGLPRRSPG